MPRRSTRRHATAATVATAATAVATAVVLPAAAFVLPAVAAAPAGATTTTSPTTSSTTPGTKPSAATEYAAAIKAARGQGVHFQSIATEAGTSIDVVGDTGSTSGAQTITVKHGSVVEHVKAVRAGATGYVNANNAALRNVIGLTSAQSSKYAGRWLSFPTSNTSLETLVAGLLDKDVASELQMQGPYSYAPSIKINGQRAVGIRGTVPTESGQSERQVLYVPANGPALPIEEVTNPTSSKSKGSAAVHGTVTFSYWGEKKTATAPTAHAVSLLKLVPPTSNSSGTSPQG
jgi:hypothetical protein